MLEKLIKEYDQIENKTLDQIMNGHLKYDPNKETIVFVSHESSATGAPLLGYNLVCALTRNYNIINIVIKHSNIHAAFLEKCDLILSGIELNPYDSSISFLKNILKKRPISCVVCNSIVTYPVLHAAYDLELPTLCLVHEFAEYTRPLGTVYNVFKHANQIIVPAKIIENSLCEEYYKNVVLKKHPNHIHVIPQGKLPLNPGLYGEEFSVNELYKIFKIKNANETKIIVGSGWVHIRKGVDLFAAMARYIKQLYDGKCKFVWVGDGFDFINDLSYSVWLKREIKYLGLEDDFVFLKHQKTLDTLFSISDVFCMTSRMDPFPNVVIDAMHHDLHIACFEDASGSVEFLKQHNGNCTIVGYLDTYRLAEGIVHHLNKTDIMINTNKNIVTQFLNFNQYVDMIEEILDKAISSKKHSLNITKELEKAKIFDSVYYIGTSKRPCLEYVENAYKNIHIRNPKPGFSENAWLTENVVKDSHFIPLYEAFRKGNTTTHDAIILPMDRNEEIKYVYAVHLHLYYVDLAVFFVNYFKFLPGKFDLYITVENTELEKEIISLFSQCSARRIKVIQVNNIGRDVGSFIFGLRNYLINNNYEVVGHFHTKKSIILGDNGDQWRKFLLDNLIGDSTIINSLLALFNDPKLGLVFPEDSHVVDIGDNIEYISELCDMMNIPQIKEISVFPLGNMFWARLDAIKDLFDLNEIDILQPEPLPYDGSYMHALERITPALVQHQGYEFKTVLVKGSMW
ncbi:MAG: rhamnan synthesis F family protein [Sulfuricurvum sp.]